MFKLIETAERSDASSGNLRNAAYEAVMDLIKYSAEVGVYFKSQQVFLIL